MEVTGDCMDIRQMREWVYKAYPGEKWRKKVDKMSDLQIKAIYLRLWREHKL